VVSTRTCKTF